MKLEKSTPEPDNWVYQHLKSRGLHLIPIEGYSVKGQKTTALFERRLSNQPVDNWTETNVMRWFAQYEQNEPWTARKVMANILNVPLYLILWQENVGKFRLFSVEFNQSNQIRVVDNSLFKSCLELAKWLGELKGISVSKGFVEPGRLSSLDHCLREHGVPWPGNLDGFLPDQRKNRVKAIFEFSRTRRNPVRTHDLNLYFHKDYNRWAPLGILSEQLDAPLIILIWSSSESIVKLLSVKEISSSELIYEHEAIMDSSELVAYLQNI